MATVRLDSLGKIYGTDVRAVDDVSLDIADGEFVVLVGPSGCGKSTTLRMIAGLEDITSGTLSIGDRVVNDVPARDRNIAMVFQNYALYPHLTVRKNLSFGVDRRRRHRSRLRALIDRGYAARRRDEIAAVRARVERAAETLGITALLERLPRELSGGQRQRVAVGRALVRNPAVFLFDEPLSNLDAKLRKEMRRELRQLHARLGATMIYVTHDQEEAMTLGDRLVVMADGRVQHCAPPLEVYERPANRFVASFIGTPPMNFLDGAVADSTFRTAGDVSLPCPAPHLAHAVCVGVRPDAIHLVDGTSSGAHAATVESVERYGDAADLVLRSGETTLVARVTGPVAWTPDDAVRFSIDPAAAHWFGPDGVRIAGAEA